MLTLMTAPSHASAQTSGSRANAPPSSIAKDAIAKLNAAARDPRLPRSEPDSSRAKHGSSRNRSAPILPSRHRSLSLKPTSHAPPLLDRYLDGMSSPLVYADQSHRSTGRLTPS